MASKKKVATSVAAVATAAALLLGGTFAWQSISQTALNEASDVVNPGGRLHNDMWYVSAEENNNDIYVENFAEDDIFARVRLEEYMEIVLNYGTAGEKVLPVIGSKTPKADATDVTADDPTARDKFDYTYEVFTGYASGATELSSGAADEDGAAYWTWQMGGETMYMPTFNMNKDSLAPDLNGLYRDRVGGISNRGAGQYERYNESGGLDNLGELGYDYDGYYEDQSKTGNEIWDYDSDMIDELETLSYSELANIINPDMTPADDYNATSEDVRLVVETHYAKRTGTTNGLISMTDWLDMVAADGGYDPDIHGSYWVYDEDGSGWVYWSSPIAGRNEDGTTNATGLLLNGTTLNGVMDDTWYYAINAVGQFVTADDAGKGDDTGFYDTTAGYPAPSDEAETLLETIGVDVNGEDGGEEKFIPQAGTLTGINMSLYADSGYMSVDEATNTLTVYPIGGWDGVDVILDHETLKFHETEITAYRMEDGAYVETDTSYIDVECYTVDGDDRVDIWLSTEAVGQYRIEVSYDDGAGNIFEGSIDFSIEAYDGPMNDDDDDNDWNPTSTIDLYPDDESDLVGGDFRIFTATVYDENGAEIANTEDVTFTVTEVTASGASTMSIDTTRMDGNVLLVADDITTSGATEVIVTASYTDDQDTEETDDDVYYEGEYIFSVAAADSPLELTLSIDGHFVDQLRRNQYQLFPAYPAKNADGTAVKYQLGATLDSAPADVTWILEESGMYYVGYENGIYTGYADGDWNEETDDGVREVPADTAVLQLDESTGLVTFLIDNDQCPRGMQVEATATEAEAGYTEGVYIGIYYVNAYFSVYDTTVGADNVAASRKTYTEGTPLEVELGFELSLYGEPVVIDTSKISNWKIADWYSEGEAEDVSSYVTVDHDAKTATVKIPVGKYPADAEMLSLTVEYNHGEIGPRNPNGISEATFNFMNSEYATGVVTSTVITDDETGYEFATYTPGTYQKVYLTATPRTQDGEVYSGTVKWYLGGEYENVYLKENGFSAEVWFMSVEKMGDVTVIADYHNPGETSIQASDTFVISPEDAGEEDTEIYTIDFNWLIDGSEYPMTFGYASSNAEACTYQLVLNEYGSPYSGEGTVSFSYEIVEAAGTVTPKAEISDSTLMLGDFDGEEEDYGVINIIASINDEQVASRYMVVVWDRGYPPSYALNFYDSEGNKAETASFEGISNSSATGAILEAGVTYTVEPYAQFYFTGVDVTEYVELMPVEEMIPYLNIAIDGSGGTASEEEAKFDGNTFTANKAGTYFIVHEGKLWTLYTDIKVVE